MKPYEKQVASSAPQISAEAPEVLAANDETKKTEVKVAANAKENTDKANDLKVPAEKADDIKIADLKISELKPADTKEKTAPQADKKVIEVKIAEPAVTVKEDIKKPAEIVTEKVAIPSPSKLASQLPTPAASEIAIKEEIIWNEAPPVQNTIKQEKTVTRAIKTPDEAAVPAKTDNAKLIPVQRPALPTETKEEVKVLQEPTALAEISPTADAKENKLEMPVKAQEIKPIEEAKALVIEKTAPAKTEPANTENSKKGSAPPVSQEDIANAQKVLQEIRIWEGKKGNSLKKRLQDWCEEVKIELVWNTDKSYDLSQNVIISGTLETALNVTFSQAVKHPPSFKITQDGLPKLIIENHPTGSL